ncbi:MAG TPA: hypothetical protein PK542_11495, partial [Treponemataceae bacterium]|nr:hypothetical protein [Treponemataceae bacterium]
MKHGTIVLQNDIRRGARALLALGLIFALAFCTSACKNNHLDDVDASPAGTGSVTVSVSGNADARLVMPSAPSASTIARYDLTCSRAEYESKTAAGLTDANALTVNELAEGEWTLTIDAYDSSGKKVATGTAKVTIVAGKTASASVVLSPILPRTAGGKGTVSLVFACSGFNVSDGLWEIALKPSAGETEINYSMSSTPIVTVDSGTNTIALNTTLDSGDWDMTFRYNAPTGTYITASTVVKVYDGLTSVSSTGGSIAVSLTDFFKADHVRYVSNTSDMGLTGKTRAQACRLVDALDDLNHNPYLTEADPGVIILT